MASFNVIVAAFCVAGLTLVFALAYNIGGTAEETRSMKMGAITRTRMETIRERLALCMDANRNHESGRENKESWTKFLQNTNDLLSSENAMFREQNQEGVLALQECVRHLEGLRETHTGTKESNATRMIEHLEEEKQKVEVAILRANSTRELTRENLRRLILAYRMEIRNVSKALAAKQGAAYRRAVEARRQTTTTQAPATTTQAPVVVPVVVAKPIAEVETAEVKENVTQKPQQETVVATTAPSCNKDKPIVIMMDAGSTGSRTHVLHFDTNEQGQLVLAKEVYEHLKPGLSSFSDNPEAAAKSLVPLMQVAVKEVPAAHHGCTPIAIKATAGLRLLGEGKSKAILDAVDKLLRSYPFAVGAQATEVMDGKDEGPYAWLTVNFLLGNLAKGKQTAAILDLGGGSTQIVFQPDSSEVLKEAPAENIYSATIRGTPLRAYQHSYLGLGLKEAGKATMAAGAKQNPESFPCFPVDHSEDVNGVVLKSTGGADFEACSALIRSHVVVPHSEGVTACPRAPCAFNGVYQPSLAEAFSGPIYAFSYFYDRMESFLPEDGVVTVGKYKEIGEKICSNSGEEFAAKNKGSMCMDFAFMYALLHDGYGLPDSRELHIKKKINGIETAWPLGAAVSFLG